VKIRTGAANSACGAPQGRDGCNSNGGAEEDSRSLKKGAESGHGQVARSSGDKKVIIGAESHKFRPSSDAGVCIQRLASNGSAGNNVDRVSIARSDRSDHLAPEPNTRNHISESRVWALSIVSRNSASFGICIDDQGCPLIPGGGKGESSRDDRSE
jgi:hypothetical protein